MIKTIKGNVLDVEQGFIVHGCNAQGVMGSGIAKEVRERFPLVYDAYRQVYEKQGGLYVGQIIPVEVSPGKWIINAITQEFFGRDEDTRYVSYSGMGVAFTQIYLFIKELRESEESTPTKLFFPKIGAGLANGDWDIISQIINDAVGSDVEKTLYLFD